MNKRKQIFLIILLLLALQFGGCAAKEDAKLIGSYPAQMSDTGEFDSLPLDSIVIYHAQIDLQVGSIQSAVDDVINLAGRYGGYTTYAYTWYADSEAHATVIVSVPSYNYDPLYDRILRLGDLQEETIVGELTSTASQDRPQLEMSSITIQFTETGFIRSSAPSGWRPLTTFSNAASVAGVIFRFLFDVLIWVVVIAGPFVLIGWGIRQAAKHWQISIKKKDLDN